jgi:16S rRNA (guanine966-N2)-methyltransferase
VAPPGDRTRPTGDRARESIFNALWSRGLLDGARVVDLFAGSGAMGIEALSRGAARATFVDSDPAARRAIATNLATCGFADRAEVAGQPVERFLSALEDPFDLAFCDPPYAFDGWDAVLGARPAPFVVVESGEPVEAPGGWSCVRDARYGAAWVGFLRFDG